MLKNNPMQEKAIKTIEKNLCLIAGAGTGKTRVLTERCLYLYFHGGLPEGEEIPSVLAVTFTEKAAAEMKQRIGRSLSREKSSKGKRLAAEFVHAPISTIHSFCQSLLREYGYHIGVSPGFEVLSEEKADRLKRRVMEDLIFRRRDEKLLQEYFSKISSIHSVSKIAGRLLRLNEERENRHLTLQVPDLSGKLPSDEEYRKLLRTYRAFGSGCRKNSKIYKLSASSDFDSYFNLTDERDRYELLTFLHDNMGSSKSDSQERKVLEDLFSDFFEKGETLNLPYYKMIVSLIDEFTKNYQREKRKRNVLDFSDLIKYSLDLVRNAEAGPEIKDRFRYIMVDEFQDTDPLQCELIYELCTKEKPYDGAALFIVGDPKQSIYGFRGSDLESFQNMVDDMTAHGAETIDMTTNYRSSKSVLEFVNGIFQGKMADYKALKPYEENSYRSYPPEIIQGEPGDEVSAVAEKILDLREEGYDFKEIALLFRSGTRMDLYEEKLKLRGIPVINTRSGNFFLRREISDLMILLEGILYDDKFSRYSVYRTPFVDLNDRSLYLLSRNEFEKGDERERKKLEEWTRKKRKLLTLLPRLELGEFIEEVMEIFHILSGAAKNDPFQIRRKNLEIFLELSYEFQRDGGNLKDFLEECKFLRDYGKQGGFSPEEGADGVRILTIHGAKGLEFPVVILPEAGKTGKGPATSFNLSSDGVVGMKAGFSNSIYERNKRERRKKEKEEELRNGYVACTRAKERLIFSGLGKIEEGSLGDMLDINEQNMGDYKISEFRDTGRSVNREYYETLQPKGPRLYESFSLKAGRKKKFYSITEFLTFKKSPTLYYLTYVLGVSPQDFSGEGMKREGISALEMGNIYHKYMEHFEEELSIIELIKADHLQPTKAQVKMLENMVRNTRSALDDTGRVMTETEFFFPVGNGIFHGFADRFEVHECRGVVVDLKTNAPRSDFKELDEYYRPQIILYTMAMEDKYKIPVDRGVLYYASADKKTEISSCPDERRQLKEELIQFMKQVEDPNFENRIMNTMTEEKIRSLLIY